MKKVFLVLLILICLPAYAADMKLHLKEIREPDGRTLYNIVAQDGMGYLAWSLEELEAFATRNNDGDSEHRKQVNAIIREELKTKTIKEFVDSLREAPKEYTIQKQEEMTVSEKNAEIIIR